MTITYPITGLGPCLEMYPETIFSANVLTFLFTFVSLKKKKKEKHMCCLSTLRRHSSKISHHWFSDIENEMISFSKIVSTLYRGMFFLLKQIIRWFLKASIWEMQHMYVMNENFYSAVISILLFPLLPPITIHSHYLTNSASSIRMLDCTFDFCYYRKGYSTSGTLWRSL